MILQSNLWVQAKELSIFEVTKDKFEIPMWLKLILDMEKQRFYYSTICWKWIFRAY
jgi:hypothetical protein